MEASPGRLTMHFEVELGVEVRPERRSPRALAQQQCSGFLGQTAPACILHQPALYYRRSRGDCAHQAWGRGARLRRWLRSQVTGFPPTPQHTEGAWWGHLPPLSPVWFQGKGVAGFAHPKPQRGVGTGASWRRDLLNPEVTSSPFHFHFPQKASRRGGGNPRLG